MFVFVTLSLAVLELNLVIGSISVRWSVLHMLIVG